MRPLIGRFRVNCNWSEKIQKRHITAFGGDARFPSEPENGIVSALFDSMRRFEGNPAQWPSRFKNPRTGEVVVGAHFSLFYRVAAGIGDI